VVVGAGLVLLVAAAGVALGLSLTRDESRRSLAPSVSLIGDSLNVGIEPYLPRQLPGWAVHTDDVPGRATAAGIEAMRSAGGSLGAHMLVSLGTNDVYTRPEDFRAGVREALRLAGPDRCVVWYTIFREGESTTALNGVLREEAERADNLHLVDWEALVRAHPNWLVGDGIHATPAGYAGRARAAADVLRSC
jgi:hypothetical protein